MHYQSSVSPAHLYCPFQMLRLFLGGKLTEEQIDLLRTFVTGETLEEEEINSDDLRRLELERQLAVIGMSLLSIL